MRPSFPSVHLSLSWSETGMRTLLSLLLVSVDSSSDSAGIAWTIGRVDLGDHDPRTAAALVSAVVRSRSGTGCADGETKWLDSVYTKLYERTRAPDGHVRTRYSSNTNYHHNV